VKKTADKPRPFRFRLDPQSGVPIYRQIIDQVTGGIAAGALHEGVQLPTVRQLAVELSINPNTVIRAYSELEIRGVLNSEQGTGTFIASRNGAAKTRRDETERVRLLERFVDEFTARAGSNGFTVEELIAQLQARKRR